MSGISKFSIGSLDFHFNVIQALFAVVINITTFCRERDVFTPQSFALASICRKSEANHQRAEEGSSDHERGAENGNG